MMEFIQLVIEWYMNHLNYFTVALLMTVESSFIPFPSEAVIPFAAYKAAQGDLNIYLVVLSGTIGALAGAFINYYLALWLGRPLIYSFVRTAFGRMLLLSEDKVQKSEAFFLKNGKSSTFIGRLVPAVRQLISIPAGLAKMDLKYFALYTTLGAGLWNVILAIVGYFLYEIREEIFPYIVHILIVAGIVFLVYLIVRSVRRRKLFQ